MTTSGTPADRTFESLVEGVVEEADYAVTEFVYDAFLRAFDDRSPIHCDSVAARERGFEDRVMHGSILHGFLSNFVGMRLPGQRALLLSSELSFQNPTYLGDGIRLVGRVTQRVESVRTVVLNVTLHNRTRDWPAAKGRVLCRVA